MKKDHLLPIGSSLVFSAFFLLLSGHLLRNRPNFNRPPSYDMIFSPRFLFQLLISSSDVVFCSNEILEAEWNSCSLNEFIHINNRQECAHILYSSIQIDKLSVKKTETDIIIINCSDFHTTKKYIHFLITNLFNGYLIVVVTTLGTKCVCGLMSTKVDHAYHEEEREKKMSM